MIVQVAVGVFLGGIILALLPALISLIIGIICWPFIIIGDVLRALHQDWVSFTDWSQWKR